MWMGPHTWWLKHFSTFHHPSWQAVKCSVADISLVSIQSCDLDVFILCKCIISWSYWAGFVPNRSSQRVSETWGLTKSQGKNEDWMRMLELSCNSCLLNYFTHNLWSKVCELLRTASVSDTALLTWLTWLIHAHPPNLVLNLSCSFTHHLVCLSMTLLP